MARPLPAPSPRFGGYILCDRIGAGGMAIVYRAKIEGWSGFEKTVVVKAMHPALTRQRDFVEMFIAEAKISAQLSHPGIVQVHDFGVFKGQPFLVMEHLDGINLSELQKTLAGKPVPIGVALVIATEMCHALGYAHAWHDQLGVKRQIIHRDVSPSNVMVCRDGTVKLLDFGVASIVEHGDYEITATLKGKYPYMAPEQLERLPIDRRVDVFAVGVILHEMLTGRKLFLGADEIETIANLRRMEVLPPSRLNPSVPPALDAIVLRALDRDPARRFDSGEEMAQALEAIDVDGGGRRHVADWLRAIRTVTCEVCGKQAVPGSCCAECGSEAAPIDQPSTVKDAELRVPAQPYVPPRPPAPKRKWKPVALGALLTGMVFGFSWLGLELGALVRARSAPAVARAVTAVGSVLPPAAGLVCDAPEVVWAAPVVVDRPASSPPVAAAPVEKPAKPHRHDKRARTPRVARGEKSAAPVEESRIKDGKLLQF